MEEWYVYVLVSETSNRTYVGISTDVPRRLLEHNGERQGGAKATRGFRPWRVGRVYGPYPSRSEASKAEYTIKKLKGAARLNVANSFPPEIDGMDLQHFCT